MGPLVIKERCRETRGYSCRRITAKGTTRGVGLGAPPAPRQQPPAVQAWPGRLLAAGEEGGVLQSLHFVPVLNALTEGRIYAR